MSQFLLDNDFSRGKVDNTLFTLHKNDELLLVQIYVDDIIFGATNDIIVEDVVLVIWDGLSLEVFWIYFMCLPHGIVHIVENGRFSEIQVWQCPEHSMGFYSCSIKDQ